MVTVADKAADLERFRAELARCNLDAPFPDYPPLFRKEPASPVEPAIWRWKELLPLLQRAGDVFQLEGGGERRVLRLTNPGLPPRSGTTRTLWASIQLIKPGEIATAHRHAATALRFIIQGEGTYTTVEGVQYWMHRGDLVLTPSWTWHDHMHQGTEPMIWLDVLDIPLTRALDSEFFEPYGEPQQKITSTQGESRGPLGSGWRPSWAAARQEPGRMLCYPWPETGAVLRSLTDAHASPFDDLSLDYIDYRTGGPTLSTMLCRCQRIRPRKTLSEHRHNTSALYYVMEGQGTVMIEGWSHAWEKGDFFVIPPWRWHRLANTSESDGILFSVHDTPVMEALGFYREQARD